MGSIQPFWISGEPVAWPWCNIGQSEEILLCLREQSLSRWARQSAVRRRWLSLCTCDRSIQKSLPFQRRFLLWERPEVAGSQIWAVEGVPELGDVMLCQKTCMRAVEWAGVLSWWSWSASSGIVNAAVTQYTSSVNGRPQIIYISRLTSPTRAQII